MPKVALICPPFFSHLRVFEALGAELAGRGHDVTFVLNRGAADLMKRQSARGGLPIREAGGKGDAARLGRVLTRAARPNGPFGILRTVADSAKLTEELCRFGPALLGEFGTDIVVGDQMEPAAGLLSRHLGLPLVSVASALPIHHDPTVPLPFLDWPFDASPQGLKRNRGGETVARFLLSRQRRTIISWSQCFGIGRYETLADCLSPNAQISQLVAGLDFPSGEAPERHRIGPIRAAAATEPPLDPEIERQIDPDRPLVFASLGTLQGHRFSIFRAVAEACREIGAQSLIAHCGGLDAHRAREIGADIVTDFVPQRTILSRSSVCVTHAGMNTVLDALGAGVPLLAISIAFDQPGIAARVAHHEAGITLRRRKASEANIRSALARLLSETKFTANARQIGREIQSSGGVTLAADIVESAMAKALAE